MKKYTKEELQAALVVVSSTISKCEKAQLNFEEGVSQHTLLKNRIKAMYISKALITGEGVEKYTKEDLMEAVAPVASVISKCEKAQEMFGEGTTYYSRLKHILDAMRISESLLTDEISLR